MWTPRNTDGRSLGEGWKSCRTTDSQHFITGVVTRGGQQVAHFCFHARVVSHVPVMFTLFSVSNTKLQLCSLTRIHHRGTKQIFPKASREFLVKTEDDGNKRVNVLQSVSVSVISESFYSVRESLHVKINMLKLVLKNSRIPAHRSNFTGKIWRRTNLPPSLISCRFSRSRFKANKYI